MRKTLRDVRLSRIPEAIGACRDDIATLVSTVNEAQQRLITDELQPDEGWWNTWAIMLFNLSQDDPYFTTPRGVARVTATNLCKKPVLLRNQFYEYMDFGNGIRPLGCCSTACENLGAWDRGQVVTFFDIAPPNKVLRMFLTDESDVGKRVFISGKDAFGNIVYSQDGLNRVTGEFVELVSPFSDTTNQWTELSGIQKDITNGPVQFFEVDTVTGDDRLILQMEPGETIAAYRRYFVNGLPQNCCGDSENIQVSALVKLDFIPVVVDTDYLLIGNLAALKEECMAIRMSEMDSTEAKRGAMAHHANALRLLAGELDLYVGKEKVSITVPIFGSDKLQRQVV